MIFSVLFKVQFSVETLSTSSKKTLSFTVFHNVFDVQVYTEMTIKRRYIVQILTRSKSVYSPHEMVKVVSKAAQCCVNKTCDPCVSRGFWAM